MWLRVLWIDFVEEGNETNVESDELGGLRKLIWMLVILTRARSLPMQIIFLSNGELTVTFDKPLLGGTECVPADETIQCFDPQNDVGADSSDLLYDDQFYALYAATASGTTLITDASDNKRYIAYRISVASSFAKKAIIVFDADAYTKNVSCVIDDDCTLDPDGAGPLQPAGGICGGDSLCTGFDSSVDFAIVVDPSNQGGVYVTGSDGTGDNNSPSTTDFFITAQSADEFKIIDAVIPEPDVGCVSLTNCYLDVLINFDDMIAIKQDDTEADADAQTVLRPLSLLDENSSFRYALTSSANLNNVNQTSRDPMTMMGP